MNRVSIPPQLQGFFAQLGNHEQYPWKSLPWKGIYNKVLFSDPVSGATMELAKVEKGATFPEHFHNSVQTLFLYKGRLRTKTGEVYLPGTFNVIPSGQKHGPFFAEEESIQFKYFSATPLYILLDGTTYIYQVDGTIIPAGQLTNQQMLNQNNFVSTYR